MATFPTEQILTKSGDSVTIRNFVESDVPRWHKFLTQIATETSFTNQYVGRPQQTDEAVLKRFNDAIHSPTELFLGVFDQDSLVALLSFRTEDQNHPWMKYNAAFGIMTLKKYWGEGIAFRLMTIMEQHARSCGIQRVEAHVRKNNARGMQFYKRLGYEFEGLRKSCAFIDGQFQDEYFIAKLLNPSTSWTPPTLETDRLILRAVQQNDAADIYEYAKNPNVSKYTLWETHKSIRDAQIYIDEYIFQMYKERTPEPFAITLKSNPNRVIGTVGCFWVSRPAKSMELAYALAEPYWGQGLATEASRAVMNYVFQEYHLERIQARCKVENTPSAKVMEKIGMAYEGTLRSSIFHRDRFWDLKMFSLIRSEWQHV